MAARPRAPHGAAARFFFCFKPPSPLAYALVRIHRTRVPCRPPTTATLPRLARRRAVRRRPHGRMAPDSASHATVEGARPPAARRPQKAPEGASTPLEASEGPRSPENSPEGPRKALKAVEGPDCPRRQPNLGRSIELTNQGGLVRFGPLSHQALVSEFGPSKPPSDKPPFVSLEPRSHQAMFSEFGATKRQGWVSDFEATKPQGWVSDFGAMKPPGWVSEFGARKPRGWLSEFGSTKPRGWVGEFPNKTSLLEKRVASKPRLPPEGP